MLLVLSTVVDRHTTVICPPIIIPISGGTLSEFVDKQQTNLLGHVMNLFLLLVRTGSIQRPKSSSPESLTKKMYTRFLERQSSRIRTHFQTPTDTYHFKFLTVKMMKRESNKAYVKYDRNNNDTRIIIYLPFIRLNYFPNYGRPSCCHSSNSTLHYRYWTPLVRT